MSVVPLNEENKTKNSSSSFSCLKQEAVDAINEFHTNNDIDPIEIIWEKNSSSSENECFDSDIIECMPVNIKSFPEKAIGGLTHSAKGEEHEDNLEISKSDVNYSVFGLNDCIENWKQFFPWLHCQSDKAVFSCIVCSSTKIKELIPVQAFQFNIKSEEEIYIVSSKLRTHSELIYHKIACMVFSYSSFQCIYNLIHIQLNPCSFSFKDFSAISSYWSQKSAMGEDFFNNCVRVCSDMIEMSIIEEIKESKLCSVVSETCSGLLYVRFLTANGKIKENFICSYLNSALEPKEFLLSCGIKTSLLVAVTSGLPCKKCSKCTKNTFSYFPCPLPKLGAKILVKELLKLHIMHGFNSAVAALQKLYVIHKALFLELNGVEVLDNLSSWMFSDKVIYFLFSNFASLKKIAFEIYKLTNNYSALGFYKNELNIDAIYGNILYYLPKVIKILYTVSSRNAYNSILQVSDIVTLNVYCGVESHVNNEDRCCKVENCSMKEQILEVWICIKAYIIESLHPNYQCDTEHLLRYDLFFNLNYLKHNVKKEVPNELINVIDSFSRLLTNKRTVIKELKLFCIYLREACSLQLKRITMIQLIKSAPGAPEKFQNLLVLYKILCLLPWLGIECDKSIFEIRQKRLYFIKYFDPSLVPNLLTISLNGNSYPPSVIDLCNYYDHIGLILSK